MTRRFLSEFAQTDLINKHLRIQSERASGLITFMCGGCDTSRGTLGSKLIKKPGSYRKTKVCSVCVGKAA